MIDHCFLELKCLLGNIFGEVQRNLYYTNENDPITEHDCLEGEGVEGVQYINR